MPGGGAAQTALDERELDKMFALEEGYWWFVGRRGIIRSVLSGHLGQGQEGWVLDLACGTGGNLAILGEHGRVLALDLSPHALGRCRERGCARTVCGSATALPLASGSVDLVASMDLLEHLDDDREGAREMFRVLRPGGVLVVTAPAYRWLWSDHDIALAHRRRYVLGEVVALLTGAGFKVVQQTYCIFFLFLPIAGFRMLQRLLRCFVRRSPPATAYIQVPRWLSAVFVWLLGAEARLLRRVSLPFGVSCLCVGRRPK